MGGVSMNYVESDLPDWMTLVEWRRVTRGPRRHRRRLRSLLHLG